MIAAAIPIFSPLFSPLLSPMSSRYWSYDDTSLAMLLCSGLFRSSFCCQRTCHVLACLGLVQAEIKLEVLLYLRFGEMAPSSALNESHDCCCDSFCQSFQFPFLSSSLFSRMVVIIALFPAQSRRFHPERS